jgi:protease-4
MEIMSEIKKRSVNPLALVLGLSAVLFGFFLIFSFVYYFMKGGEHWKNGDQQKMFADKNERVAVIEVKGVILESKKALRNLKDAEEDKTIKAVVLRLNSPGGAVAPSQEIYEAVKRFKKPLVVSMGSVAASGAYYIAAGSKRVFANAGTLTGSIGVIMEFMNLRKLYEWAKVERYSVKTGKFKDSGADWRDLSPEEREYFQALVMDTLGQFKGAVAEGRKLSAEEVNAVADGRVFTGTQALKLKLVDELGTLEDAVRYIAKEAGFKGKPQVVYPIRKMKGLQEFLMGSQDEEDGFEEEESSFIDRLVGKVTERLVGGSSEARVLPAGLYAIWHAAR